ncbi:Hypothetical Protein FCC1311_099322 [Hondaea fermentalgiana]|uniref:Uncharacterized protein n=1 Tax=Hondaea fermentalgiana TaxID=2315210 RepID=A0A2R5GTR1_9STRA|nr:Hypothetical Protein FCC1311_099322 [Hondaea fermentalgiana]|eukprot:GBG33709.1 Hypothetical Protein FCC1311_099322 [Hondaea fermentalgiana]
METMENSDHECDLGSSQATYDPSTKFHRLWSRVDIATAIAARRCHLQYSQYCNLWGGDGLNMRVLSERLYRHISIRLFDSSTESMLRKQFSFVQWISAVVGDKTLGLDTSFSRRRNAAYAFSLFLRDNRIVTSQCVNADAGPGRKRSHWHWPTLKTETRHILATAAVSRC